MDYASIDFIDFASTASILEAFSLGRLRFLMARWSREEQMEPKTGLDEMVRKGSTAGGRTTKI